MFYVGEETFFKKKAFFPHTPILQELCNGGAYFFIIVSALDR